MFMGINMFWARLRLILALATRLSQYHRYHFGGHWEKKIKKKRQQNSLNMKGKFDKSNLRDEIHSAIAKRTVWHNWLNRVRLAWSRKTYMHFATAHGATTRGIYIRSFSESASNFCRSSSSSLEDWEFRFCTSFTVFTAMIWAWKWRHHFFYRRCKKTTRMLRWLLDFDWLLISYDCWFSLFIGLFQRAKIHFSPPNFPF